MCMRSPGFSTVVVLASEKDWDGLVAVSVCGAILWAQAEGVVLPAVRPPSLWVLTSSRCVPCLCYGHLHGSQTLEQRTPFLLQSGGGKRPWVCRPGEQPWSNGSGCWTERLTVQPPQQCWSGVMGDSCWLHVQYPDSQSCCESEGGWAGTHPGRTVPTSEMLWQMLSVPSSLDSESSGSCFQGGWKHLVLQHPAQEGGLKGDREKAVETGWHWRVGFQWFHADSGCGRSWGERLWVEAGTETFWQVFFGGLGRLCLGFHDTVGGGPKLPLGAKLKKSINNSFCVNSGWKKISYNSCGR